MGAPIDVEVCRGPAPPRGAYGDCFTSCETVAAYSEGGSSHRLWLLLVGRYDLPCRGAPIDVEVCRGPAPPRPVVVPALAPPRRYVNSNAITGTLPAEFSTMVGMRDLCAPGTPPPSLPTPLLPESQMMCAVW